MAAQAKLEEVLAELSSVEGVSSIQRIVCGGCHDFKVVTKLPEKAFGDWATSEGFEAFEDDFLAALRAIPGITNVDAQTFAWEEVKMNKKDIKKAQEKKEKEAAEKPEEEKEKPKEDPAKKLKKVIKEGGKRGVEIEGAADMGGLQFFCTSVDEPQGDLELLMKCVEAMNEKSDPTEEERKGGSGAIGKMVFSAGGDKLAMVAYVPEEKLGGELVCEAWLQKLCDLWEGGKVTTVGKTYCVGMIPANGEKNIFPLKIRESLILEANNFLRKIGLFPEDNGSDSDEMVFGDDDFPSM